VLRISKLTDYGTVLLANLAANQDSVCSAADVANATGIAVPTVSKLLKSLGRSGLVISTRGTDGGYQFAKDPQDIRISVRPTSSTHSRGQYPSLNAAQATVSASMKAFAASAAHGRK